MADSEQEGADPYPDSPVRRVEIEHEDGTVKRIQNEEAAVWMSHVRVAMDVAVGEGALGFGSVNGQSAVKGTDWQTWRVDHEGGEN